MRRRGRCGLCRKRILDPGSQLLSKVNLENFINWCKIMMQMERADVAVALMVRHKHVCRYCVWDARYHHEHTNGSIENTVWWSTDDAIYKYYEANMIKPCEMRLRKLTGFRIKCWEKQWNSFDCKVCGKEHGTYNALYLHIFSRHPDKKLLMCPLCNAYVLTSTAGLQEHLEEFHKGEVSISLKTNALKCQFCDRIFTGKVRKYLRTQHLRKFHPAAIRCAHSNCCRYFRTQVAMEKHAKEKHNDVMAREKMICIFCGESYLGKGVLNGHVRNKHKREAIFCRLRCGMHFKSDEEVQAHVKTVHEDAPNEGKIQCIICEKMISNLTIRIHVHMRLKHPKEAFKCKKTVCTSYFKSEADAIEHFQATHASTVKTKFPFIFCDFCKFQTRYPNGLRTHIVARHFPRTFKCPECPKLFASEDHINEHARKTHSKKRKKCPHCGMTPAIYNTHVVNTKCLKCCQPFKCFALLQKHRKECKLVFKCDICEKHFKVESTLLKHFKSAHRKINSNLWLGANKYRNSKFTCTPCKIYFENEGFFNNHIRNNHKDENKLTCYICKKLVRNKQYMQNHLVQAHNILK